MPPINGLLPLDKDKLKPATSWCTSIKLGFLDVSSIKLGFLDAVCLCVCERERERKRERARGGSLLSLR